MQASANVELPPENVHDVPAREISQTLPIPGAFHHLRQQSGGLEDPVSAPWHPVTAANPFWVASARPTVAAARSAAPRQEIVKELKRKEDHNRAQEGYCGLLPVAAGSVFPD